MTVDAGIVPILKISVLVSVLFVWVIRYDNIIKEFKEYELPDWLRDFVGILKIICVVLINSSNTEQVKLGALVLAFLMGSAMFTHIRVKIKLLKCSPLLHCFYLACLSTLIRKELIILDIYVE